MSNSSLVVHTNISPNRNSPRTAKIDTITIHCVVGQCTAESLGEWFKPSSRAASSNYGVDKTGRVGMYVEEKDRSWCSSSAANDHRAITIEVASDTTEPYAVNAVAMAALIDLCADICKRNGIQALLWKNDKNLIGQTDKQNMTVHRWFASKSCPGEYLMGKMNYIAEEVNKRLNIAKTSIAGTSVLKASDLAAFLLSKNPQPKINCTVDELAGYFITDGKTEGIRGDIAFCQSLHETGYFKYGGLVDPSQNNYAGIGATGAGVSGAAFPTPQTGVRAQIQHLKAYCNTEPLVNECVDPRFNLVKRGAAPCWEDLNGKWAVPGTSYGQNILKIYDSIPITPEAITPEPIEPPSQVVSDWAKDAWQWAIDNKICDGTRPKDLMTREEAITIIYRLFKVLT